MSMTAITALQLAGIFCAYTTITILLPHIVVGKSIPFRNRYERFMLYTVLGNFYVINLVYILELLHISHKITLYVFTILPLAYIKIKLENIPFKEMSLRNWEMLRRFSGGQLKFRAYRDLGKDEREIKRKTVVRKYVKVFLSNIPDLVLILGLLVSAAYVFGYDLFKHYGYKLADVVVHNFWINRMSENVIFTKGVYPFGFHNVMYYMHEVFGFDTYVLLRLSGLVGIVWASLLLLCFLKLVCKSRFIPYLGVYAYVLFDFLETDTYARFCALIPQEYSMLFLFPTIYCIFAYFREQRREENGCAAGRSRIYIGGFVMSFSLTLTTHFYSTIILGIYIVAISVAFARWLFKRPYFRKLSVSLLMAVAIAILPMVTAYVFGKELEYSLKWALSIMTGYTPVATTEDEARQLQIATSDTEDDGDGIAEPIKKQTLFGVNKAYYREIYGNVKGTAAAFLVTVESKLDNASIRFASKTGVYLIMSSFVLMILLGIGLSVKPAGDKIYGATLSASGLFMVFMSILVSAEALGVPQLMDINRSGIFFSYTVCASVAIFADSLVHVVLKPFGNKLAFHVVSLAIVVCSLTVVFATGNIRDHLVQPAYESNGAVTCLTRIISEEEKNKWTICSANDEGNMVYGKGFHYELIDFLRAMEKIGSSGWIRIPTETVYFFIEKYPIDYYYNSWEGSNTPISTGYAEKELPLGNSRSIYEGENRWICMSRYYYWAEAFRKLYPNEMTVYYETDEFICYRAEQNPYRVFNFAIDYGYNMP